MRAIFAFLFVLLLAGGAAARALTDGEQSTLNQARDLYAKALKEADYETIVGFMPPRVVAFLAQSAGVTEAALQSDLAAHMTKTMGEVAFVEFEMATERIPAREVRDADGASYVWGLAPTSMVMTFQGKSRKVETQTLVLLDRAQWYLVRIDAAQQVAVLKATYPFLRAVDFARPAVTE